MLGNKSNKLSAKVFELLCLFLANDEHIVSREEAIEKIWLGNSGVGERGYTNAIWTLRKAFKELSVAEKDIFITLPKVGYQLILTVSPISANKINPAVSAKKLKIISFILVAFFLIVIGFDESLLNKSEPESVIDTAATPHSKVTNFEGIEEYPTVSNNGNYVVFQWGREHSKGNLYIKNLLDPKIPLNLISMGDQEEAAPAWSSNDSLLAYIRISEKGECQVRVKHLVTNNDILIDKQCYHLPFRRVLAWSNDNDNTLIYAKQLDNKVALFQHDFVSNTNTQITFPVRNEVNFAPHLSKDNQSLAFIKEKSSVLSDIVIQDSLGQQQVVLGEKLTIIDFDWNFNKNEIVTSYAVDGKFSITRIDLATLKRSLVTDQSLPSTLSLNGKTGKLLFSNHTSKEYIAEVNMKNGKITRRISSSSRDMYGRFVPNSDNIMFLSNRADKWSVWVNDRISSENITSDLGNATVPSISPDGKHVVVAINDIDNSKRSLYLASLPENKFVKLNTGNLIADNLSWSSTNNGIYFSATNDNSSGIFKLSLVDQSISQITSSGEQYAQEGNNGELFVTRVNQKGIWRYSVNTKEFTLVTDELESYDLGAFFWQNEHLYYLNRTTKEDQIKSIYPHTDAKVVTTFTAGHIRKFFGISNGKDGHFIATLKLSNEADIHAIQL